MPIPLALIAGGAALGSAVLGARSASKANKAQQDALGFEKERWNAGQPFRQRGTELLNQEVDYGALNDVFMDTGNPYSAGQQARPLMRTMTPAASVGGPRTAQPRGPMSQWGRPSAGMGMPDARISPMGEPMAPDMGAQGAVMGGEMDADLTQRRAQLAALASMLGPQMGPQMGGGMSQQAMRRGGR